MNGELLGWACIAGLILAAAGIHNRHALREWWDRDPVSLDDLDRGFDMPTSFYEQPITPLPRCWSTGPSGGHAYKVEGGVWTCMRCGDRREAS